VRRANCPPGGLLGSFGGGRVGGDDRGLDQVGEPAPGDPPIGGLGHPLVHIRRVWAVEVAGATSDVSCVGGAHLTRLNAAPQPWQPVGEIKCVGDELLSSPCGAADAGTELRRRERRDLRRAGAAEPLGGLSAGQRGLLGVDRLGAVDDRPLRGDEQQLRLGLEDLARQRVGGVEQLRTRHRVEGAREDHAPIPAATTDIEPCVRRTTLGPDGPCRTAY